MIDKTLKLIRNYHNVKQKDLAAKLEMSPSHLSEIESGSKPVSYELLEKYALIFSIPVSTIALFNEATSKSTTSITYQVCDKAVKLLDWLQDVSKIQSHTEDKLC